MRIRKLVYTWVGIIIAVGVFSLLGTFLQLRNLEITFQELQGPYKAVIILSISLMSISLLITVLWMILHLLKIEWVSSLEEKIIGYIDRPQTRLILFILLVLASFISAQILLQSDSSGNRLGVSFIDITQIFFIWVILTSFISLIFLLIDKKHIQGFKQPDIFIPILLAVSIMILLGLLNGSKYGFNKSYQPEIEGVFRLTGFPILDYQVLLSWIAVVGVFFLIWWYCAN